MTVTLKNQQKTDIRRFKVEVTAFPKPIKAILEFRVPARNQTTQEIPIINNSEKDWTIRVTMNPDPSKIPNCVFTTS